MDILRFLREVFRDVSGVAFLVVGALACTVLSVVLEGAGLLLLVPLVQSMNAEIRFTEVVNLQMLIDPILSYPLATRIQIIAAGIALVGLLKALVEYAGNISLGYMQNSINMNLVLPGYDKMMRAQLPYLQRYKFGQISTWANQHPSQLSAMFRSSVEIMRLSIIFIFYMAISIVASPKFAVIAFTFLLAVTFFMRWTFASQRKVGHTIAQLNKNLAQACAEAVIWMKHVRLGGAEDRAMNKIRDAISEHLVQSNKIVRNSTIPAPLFNAVKALAVAGLLLLWVVIYGDQGEQWLGVILVFGAVLSRLAGPVSSFNQQRMIINLALTPLREYLWFRRELDNRQMQNGTQKFEGLREKIEFKNVSFVYDRDIDKKYVLNNFSISFEKGSFVALVGESGGGKSTIASLVPRLYDPDSGAITVDGRDLRDFDLNSLREKIGFVSQDSALFHDTVANNIKFARPDATRDQIYEVAKLSGADQFIRELPDGYDTIVGEQGSKLSGGQRQRLAIARALLQNPEVLIFDEATSQLDTATEKIIQDLFERLRGKHTLIVIAHRLSTIEKADEIAVVSGGKLSERGKHEDLIAAKGEYWKLLNANTLGMVEQTVEDVR